MDIKQGEEKTQFVKDENEETEKYIFQKNTKTKFGFSFILTVLIIIIAAILVSLYFFNTPA